MSAPESGICTGDRPPCTGDRPVAPTPVIIDIEIDPGYFEIACRRIIDALRQSKLFEAR